MCTFRLFVQCMELKLLKKTGSIIYIFSSFSNTDQIIIQKIVALSP